MITLRSIGRLAAAALILTAGLSAPLHAAPKADKAEPAVQRYLIAFNAGNEGALRQAIQRLGGTIAFDYTAAFNGLAADMSPAAMRQLRRSGYATSIEEDSIRSLHALPGGWPDGADFDEFVPWGRDRVQADVVWSTDPNLGPADNGIAGPNVRAGAVTGEGVVVAVLDTGIDYDHPDLVDNVIDDCGSGVIRDFLVAPGDDCPEDDTFNGHGTSVASVIASVDNEVGLIGVAPGAHVRPYRVCDGGCPLSAIIGGIIQATLDGADVINMSFGGPAGFNFEASAVQFANRNGVVLVASAGNESTQKPSFPAAYDTVIAVGATNINDAPASFTNVGGWVDVTGPGVDNPTATCTGCVVEATLDETAPASRQFSPEPMTGSAIDVSVSGEIVNAGRACSALNADLTGQLALIERGDCSFALKVQNAEAAGATGTVVYNNAPGNFGGTLGAFQAQGPAVSISQEEGQVLAADIASATTTVHLAVNRLYDIEYWLISGTSFSGPHVAGVAALVKSVNPGLSPIQVRKIIEKTAEPIGPQVIFGAGMVRADRAVEAAQQ